MRVQRDFYAAARDALVSWPGSDADADRRRLSVLAEAAADRAERLHVAGFPLDQVQAVLEWETQRAASEFDGLALSDRLRTAAVVSQVRSSVEELGRLGG